MGEYYKGVKLGTCTDWRYVRYDELSRIRYESAYIEHNLDSDAILWRFPWPDEDGQTWRAADARNMFRTHTLPAPVAMPHERVCVSLHALHTNAYTVNVFVPCPLDREQKPRPIMQIIGEKHRAGRTVTVFGCAYCGALWVATPEELEVISATWRSCADADERAGHLSQARWLRSVIERLGAA